MKFNAPDVAISTAVFELLVGNPADADCLCTSLTNKRAPEKLVNAVVVYLG